MNCFSLTLIAFCANISAICGLQVLGVFPHPGKSHVSVFVSIMKGLAEKGHNVTVLSYFPLEEPVERYKDVNIQENLEILEDFLSFGMIDPDSRLHSYMTIISLKNLAATTCEAGMNSQEFRNFFKSKQRYDVMLVELFNTDCFIGLADKFQSEIIGLSSSTLMPWYYERFGDPMHTAYVPNNLLPFSDKMNFLQRVENTLLTLVHKTYYNTAARNSDIKLAKDLLGTKASDIRSAIWKMRLLLINTHFTLNLPKPIAPNFIEIGGVHLKQPKQLPKNLEKWISESKHGVIYFSMGSLLKGNTLPKDKKDAFLKAFARLPQRVLWKWESDEMEDKPENVMTQKWMPQFDILSHPNVKAFIGHGGLLGAIEAVHNAVPMIVMPQFGDQHTNAKAIEENGGGIILPLSAVTEETVLKALTTVLSSSFRDQAKQLSERFRDRPLPPLETAIYWIEYVARHRGATHLRTAAVDMPFYQYYLLDVFSFLIFILSMLLYGIYYFIRTVLRLFTKTSNKVKTT